MESTLERIVIDAIIHVKTTEELISELKSNNIPIVLYNEIILNVLRIVRKRARKENGRKLKSKTLKTRKLIDKKFMEQIINNKEKCLPADSGRQSAYKIYEEYVRRTGTAPPLFSIERGMLSSNDINKRLSVFADYFNLNIRLSEKMISMIREGCKKLIENELNRADE